MKRLLSLTILMLSSFFAWGQSYMSPQGEWYHKRFTIKWNLGLIEENYYIRIGMYEFAVSGDIAQLNDRFAIETKDGDMSVVVTEEVLRQKSAEGFMKFPLSHSDIKRISKGVRHIVLIRDDNVKYSFREYDHGMMCDVAKSVLSIQEPEPIKTHTQKVKTNIYPSWRD